MVFRRGFALMCIAAAVALVDVTVDAKEHHHHHKQQHVAVKESKIEYPNGHVLISSSDNAAKPADDKKHAKKHTKHAKKADDDDSSDDVAKHHKKHHKKQSKKVEETTAANGEVTRKYAHGSVRIFKQPSSGAAATAKGNKQVHTHAKGVSGDVTKDFALTEGVNTFAIEGVPLQVTLNHGKVDVRVNGQHVETGGEITVDAPTAKAIKAKAAAVQKPEEVAVAAPADQVKAAVDDKAERVTTLAAKLETTPNNHHGIFETTPVMIICGVIGALAAVVGVAAVAVTRSRTGAAAEDANLQSVLADASEHDLEAAAEDAPADQSDSLEDSSDDDDDDDADAGEGTFANNEQAVSV